MPNRKFVNHVKCFNGTCEHHTTGGYPTFVIFNSLWSVMSTWRPRECHLIQGPQIWCSNIWETWYLCCKKKKKADMWNLYSVFRLMAAVNGPYHSVQNLSPCCLLCIKLRIRIYRTMILLLLYMGLKPRPSHKGKNMDWKYVRTG
jgi:hypothetical protein